MSQSEPRQLVRSLSLVPAASVILANIIGTGIFVKTRVMTCNVGSPTTVMIVWVFAGLLSLAGALVYAELSTMMPRSGGEFNFIGAAFGRLWAFIYGWTRAIAGCASSAAVAILTVTFLNDLTGQNLSPLMLRVLPVGVLVLAMALNLRSAKASGAIATALTIGKITLVLGIAIGAFVLGDGSWAHFGESGAEGDCAGVANNAKLGATGFGAAMLGALWSYNGWNVITAIGGEVKNPGRTLPRALIGGTFLVITLYLFINVAYFYVLSPLEIANIPESSSIAYEVAARFVGAGTAAVLSAGLMLSAYGTLHAGFLTGPRLPYALAKHGLLPHWLTRLSTHGVPAYSVLALGGLSIALTLSGTFNTLTDMYVFVLWIFYGMVCAALFVLRAKYPDAERPCRAWGYPVIPIIFLLVTVYLLINTLIATPGRAIAGLALIIAGLPVYAWYRRQNPEASDQWLGDAD